MARWTEVRGRPARGLSWTVSAIYEHSWIDAAFPYWEGPVEADGTTGGVGYLEMTGY